MKKITRTRELLDEILNEEQITYKDFFEYLTEVKKVTVGRFTAHGHQPHFVGGEYHGHCEVEGGKQISFTVSGKVLHPNKFPAKVPQDAKLAIAKLLNKPVELFGECYWIKHNGMTTLLLESGKLAPAS